MVNKTFRSPQWKWETNDCANSNWHSDVHWWLRLHGPSKNNKKIRPQGYLSDVSSDMEDGHSWRRSNSQSWRLQWDPLSAVHWYVHGMSLPQRCCPALTKNDVTALLNRCGFRFLKSKGGGEHSRRLHVRQANANHSVLLRAFAQQMQKYQGLRCHESSSTQFHIVSGCSTYPA